MNKKYLILNIRYILLAIWLGEITFISRAFRINVINNFKRYI